MSRGYGRKRSLPDKRITFNALEQEREAELERDAEAMLQKHLGKIEASQANSRILFQKIKERLAKERDVVL